VLAVKLLLSPERWARRGQLVTGHSVSWKFPLVEERPCCREQRRGRGDALLEENF